MAPIQKGLFSIATTSLGEERAYLSAFRMFVRFAYVWFCPSPLLLGVWKGLWFVIVALPGFFFYLFFSTHERKQEVRIVVSFVKNLEGISCPLTH